jgi:hypothetical protein
VQWLPKCLKALTYDSRPNLVCFPSDKAVLALRFPLSGVVVMCRMTVHAHSATVANGDPSAHEEKSI